MAQRLRNTVVRYILILLCHLCLGLQSSPFFSYFSSHPVCLSLYLCIFHMPCLSYSSIWSLNNTWQHINIMQFLIMHFFFSILLLPASLAQTILTVWYTVSDKQHIKNGLVVSVHAMTHRESTDIAQVFCNLSTWRRWVVNFNALATLFLEK